MNLEVLILARVCSSVEALQKALQAGGVGCALAGDLSSAQLHLQSRSTSLLLADLELLAMDEFAWLRSLTSRLADLRIVVLARGTPDESLLARALNAGALDFITEPFHEQESLRRVRLAASKTSPPATSPGSLPAALPARPQEAGPVVTQESEAQAIAERWQLIFDTAQVAMALVDADRDTYIRVNEAYASQRGYTCDELAGKPVFTIFPEQNWPEMRRNFERMRAEGFATFEVLHKRKDGSIFPVLTQVMTLHSKEGKALFRVAYVIDITARRNAEAALRATEARLRTTLNTMMEGCQFLKNDWTYFYVNSQVARRALKTPEEMEGKSVFDIWPGIKDTPLFAKLERCMETRELSDFETTYLLPDGNLESFNVSVRPVPEGLLVFSLDITKRKQAEEALQESEQRFRDLAFTTADLVWEAGLDARFTYLSAGVKLLLGYEPEELVGKATPFDSMPPGESERVLQIYSELAARRQPFHDLESVHIHKDGSLRHLCSSGVPFFDKKGELLGYRGSGRDITPRKQAEDQLHVYSKQLQALSIRLENLREEERTRISREIHDELGQILTGIKMDLKWVENRLQEQASGTNVKPLVRRINAASDLVDTTVRTVQRIAAELRPGILDTLGLPTALRYESARFQERTGIRCAVKLPRDPLILPRECATAFFRIFQEALTNVARHARATEVTTELRMDGDICHMEIVDNGIGIKREPASMSLGLLGMEERAKALGGWTHFVARLEGGTAVIVRLPAKHLHAAPPK